MKREYVVPDALAAMTADALFAGKPQVQAVPPTARKRESLFSLGRWFKPAPGNMAATVKPQAPRLTLDDDWVGGWYARTRLLQAATLANAGGAPAEDAPGGKAKVTANVINQLRDLS
jgi:hypothetical protein